LRRPSKPGLELGRAITAEAGRLEIIMSAEFADSSFDLFFLSCRACGKSGHTDREMDGAEYCYACARGKAMVEFIFGGGMLSFTVGRSIAL